MKFEYAGTVPSPPDEVFALVSNIERKHEWVKEVLSSRQTSEGPVRAGTTYVDNVRFMGRDSEIPTVITAYEPGRLLAYRHTDGPIIAELRYEMEPDGGGTRLAISIDAEFPWYFRILKLLLAGQMRRQMDANFEALKRLLAAG